MLTLNDAIKHYREKAEELKNKGFDINTRFNADTAQGREYYERAEKCEQVAEWLTDYKRLLEAEKEINGSLYRNEHCNRAGKCFDYIGWHCTGCNEAKER